MHCRCCPHLAPWLPAHTLTLIDPGVDGDLGGALDGLTVRLDLRVLHALGLGVPGVGGHPGHWSCDDDWIMFSSNKTHADETPQNPQTARTGLL